jgi:hypothetical protein
MIFADYRHYLMYTVCGLFAFAGIWAFWSVRKMKPPARIILRLLLALVGLPTCLFFIIMLGFVDSTVTKSAFIFSPSRKQAIRIEDIGGMPPAFSSRVDLFSHTGLSSDVIAGCDIGATEAKDVHWVNEAQVLVETHPDVGACSCKSTSQVAVTCSPVVAKR